MSDEVSDPLAFEGMTEEHGRRACEPVQVQLEPVDKPFPNLHRGEVAVVHHGDPVEVRRDGRFAAYCFPLPACDRPVSKVPFAAMGVCVLVL